MTDTPDRAAVSALPFWRQPAAMENVADFLAVLIAVSLPWSTSLLAIFVVAWLVALAPTLDIRLFLLSLKRPVCALPITFFAMAAAGTLWSDAPMGVRLYAISPAAKLLVLPMLLYYFERSSRGMWVLTGFLVSCTLLMLLSWIVAFDPRLALRPDAAYGVPFKNYIDQSQEFVLCAVVIGYLVVSLLRSERWIEAALLATLASGFLANMAFITVSRTALVTIPFMIGVFALLHLKARGIVVLLCSISVLAGTVWLTSPLIRKKSSSFLSEYTLYQQTNEATSIGLRLEFWRKSFRLIGEAPVVGHGTGSTQGLFERAAVGQAGAAAAVIGNPHNQTLNVAVQWGAAGVVVLYTMWLLHLLLFRGDGLIPWIGLAVVIQNVASSLFNSHLFDFHEGWMYVLGVGVAGGMTLKARAKFDANRERTQPSPLG